VNANVVEIQPGRDVAPGPVEPIGLPEGPLLHVPSAAPQWMNYGDAIRILGTIAVVIGHCADMALDKHPLSMNWWACNLWDSGVRWAVPAYILLSGALLLDPARSETPKKFYQKRLMRIGIPLVFWSIFFMWFSVFYTQWVTPRQAWMDLLKGQPYVHMHFIFRIAGLYAFTPMIRVFLRHSSRSMQIGTVVTLLALSSADSVANGVSGTELSAFASFAPFLGYYLAGYLLRATLVSRRTLIWCWIGLIVTIAMLAGGTGWLVSEFGMKWYPSMGMLLYDFLSPVRVVMAICAWLILVKIFHQPWPKNERARSILRGWANTTLGLYLIHPMFREMFYLNRFGMGSWSWHLPRAIDGTWPNLWLGIPLMALAVYIPALLATIGLMKIPYVRRITG
jgi:surface polysaccharide O-acyltransferase-like enzyme